ncbi:MAG: DUF5993 family protein [Burkholderiales bacterium]|jgi:hypothetical protein|nr:DUF5993 family protein [Burkholderiales bacterium]
MSMMLPFVTAGLGLGLIVAGWRLPAVVMFVVTLALYTVTLVSHMTDTLAISL